MSCNIREFLQICRIGTIDQIENMIRSGCDVNEGFNLIVTRDDMNIADIQRLLVYSPIIDYNTFIPLLSRGDDNKVVFLIDNIRKPAKDSFYTYLFYLMCGYGKNDIARDLLRRRINIVYDINDVNFYYVENYFFGNLHQVDSDILLDIILSLPIRLLNHIYTIPTGNVTFLQLILEDKYYGRSTFDINLLISRSIRIDIESLYLICKYGDTETLSRIVHRLEQDVYNPADGGEFSPLMIAAANCHTDIVDILLNIGANVNYSDYQGISVLMALLGTDTPTGLKMDVLDRLLAAQIDLNHKNNEGETALFYVNDKNILSKLVLYGEDINHLDNNGHTVLYHAIGLLRYDLVKAILAFGPSISGLSELLDNPESYVPQIGYKIHEPKYMYDFNLPVEERNELYRISQKLIRDYLSNYGL